MDTVIFAIIIIGLLLLALGAFIYMAVLLDKEAEDSAKSWRRKSPEGKDGEK